jgi:hypothetical protein
MKPYITEEETYRGATEIKLHFSVCFNPQADIALKLMQHLAIVATVPDGEDSSGRQRLRMMNPIEIAERACAIAFYACEEFERRGWLTPMPAPKPQKRKEEL